MTAAPLPRPIGYDPLRDSRHRTARAARECADWLAWLELEGKAPRTLDDYERTAAVLLRSFPDLTIQQIGDGELLHVLKQFPAASRRVRRSHLSSFIGWAYRTGRIPRNPLDLVPKPKRPARRVPPTFTEAEQAALAALPTPDGQLMLLLLDTGIRKGEARRMRARDIDFSRRRIIIGKGKGGKGRVVGITRRLHHALDELLTLEGIERDHHLWYSRPGGGRINRQRVIGEGSFHRWYVRCLEDAGVEYVAGERGNPHTTRHTFALRWLRAGGRLETLSETLGHASIKTTYDEYGHLDMDDVLADLDLLEL